MLTNIFLEQVLPPTGQYCVVGLKKDSAPRQKLVGSIEELERLGNGLAKDGYETYFALASYADPKGGRVTTNAVALKAFFVDLDCGTGKPYETQEEGLTALRAFVKKVGLPKPTVVNSGRGLHVYWALQEPMPKEQWKPYAEAFKLLCDVYDLKADPVVTADVARILRIPNTFNFKDVDNPTPVEVVITGSLVDNDVFKQLLKVSDVEPAQDSGDIFAGMTGKPFIPREMDAMTMALMGNSQSRFKTILMKSLSGEGCPQIVNIYENQESIEEPLWRAGLSIAHACIDGEKAIHIISKKHPGYSEYNTQKKASDTKGPYTCATFKKINPKLCQGCPHNITSPIQLGKEIVEADEADNSVQHKEHATGEVREYVIPKYPYPFFRGKVGGIYVRSKNPETEEDEDVLVYPYDFYVVKRMHDPDKGECILTRLHLPRDGVREFILPLTEVVSKERFRDAIAERGLAVLGKKQETLMAYITRWVEELQASSQAELARKQFGWLADDSGFVVGDKEITATEIKYSPPTATTLELVPMFREKGDFHVWKDVINAYAREQMEAKAFAFFMGFGNVLLKFTPLKGYLLSLKSQGSGSGKTTILHAIGSIYGHPEDSFMRNKDTYNQKLQRIGTFQNIPILYDEMTNLPPDQKSNLAYDITEGRAKNRLRSQENAERINHTKWATGLITTSNRSLRDDLLSIKAFPEGELMRIMELHIFNDPNDDPQWSRTHFARIHHNYGHAIFPFIQYVIANLPEVIAFIETIQTKIEQAADIRSQERYWSTMATLAIVGGIIAKNLNLHDIDHRPVLNYIVKHIRESRQQNNLLMLESSDFLGGFLNRKFHETLTINGKKDGRTGLETGPIREPKGALTIRYEPDTKLLFVVAKEYRAECAKMQLNFDESIAMHKSSGAFKGTKRKRMTAGTIMGAEVNVPALVFDSTKLDFFREDKFLNAEDSESDDTDSVETA